MAFRADVAPGLLARVVRDGFVESVHSGHVAVAGPGGVAGSAGVLGSVGDPSVEIYPRSALKPFQAAAVLGMIPPSGPLLDHHAIAIASASHAGSTDHQTEVARLLALAGLDEDALQCPPAYPSDLPALRASARPERLSHNCSGKHAAFLLAQVLAGDDPARYRDTGSAVQRRVRQELADLTGATPRGPGVDGCGAPAWRLPLAALATGFARLAEARPAGPAGLAGGAGPAGGADLGRVAEALRTRPDLVGGSEAQDTLLMLADLRVVAKRGAEAVFAAGVANGRGGVGVAVKVVDGGARAAGPVVATVLAELGITVPADLACPPVLGGGQVHGRLDVSTTVVEAARHAREASR